MKKYKSPEKSILQSYIDDGLGKSHIAKIENVSIPVVERWLKEYNIKIRPYHGRKYFKTYEEEIIAISKINKCLDMNVSEISRHTQIPRQIINKLRNENKIKLKTQFDLWQEKYDNIIKNLNYYVQENQTKSLKEISIEDNVSVEQLKKAFKENNIEVKLHSYNKSRGELECKEFIESMGVDCYSVMIDKTFEIDCFVKSAKFGLEYCGEFWHKYDPEIDNKNYHKNKYNFCLDKDINLMTIFESEWKNKKDIIKSMIKSRLGLSNKIQARKCIIKEIPSSIAEKFHKNNHIQGYIKSSINIGCFHNNKCVCVLSIMKSRFDKKYQYEISRFSSIHNTNVIGGLGKCFSYFLKNYDPSSCMTYSDLRFGKGKCYEKIGFNFVSYTVPNYFYIEKGGDILESRFKYQKNMLKNMKGYSWDKTEYEIMTENNYYRLYDCGNAKYEWVK